MNTQDVVALNLNSAGEAISVEPFNPRRDARRRFFRNKVGVLGLLWAILIAFVAVAADFIDRFDYAAQALPGLDAKGEFTSGCSLQGPTAKHWLGCDLLGRDLWSRICHGARISMTIALATITVSLVISLILGAISGFSGGKWDSLIMRIADIFSAVPYFAVVLAFTATFGHSIIPLSAAIVTIGWMSSARLFRSSVMQIRGLDYVEAARAAGLSTKQIVRKHVAPNAIQPIMATLGASIGGAILSESVLSFLGIGLLPPTPSWGVMVGESRDYLSSNPHLFFVPAGALLITTLAFTFMGDALRDALDPKLRGVK
jgi:peptide/nickel transport system permease protein